MGTRVLNGLCQELCQGCPLRQKRLSHGFLQIFILLKSSSLPGVLRLKTTVSHSHIVSGSVNWYYLYGEQFNNSY